MTPEQRSRWFAHMLTQAIEQKIITAADILQFASPDVLAEHLPPDALARLLSATLSAGSMPPEKMLEVIPVSLISQHVPPDYLWKCLTTGLERSGVHSE